VLHYTGADQAGASDNDDLHELCILCSRAPIARVIRSDRMASPFVTALSHIADLFGLSG